MRKVAVFLLVLAMLCSACGLATLSKNHIVNDEPSFSVQTEYMDEKDIFGLVAPPSEGSEDKAASTFVLDSEGLEDQDFRYLQKQREEFRTFTYEELQEIRRHKNVPCLRLNHLEWEHNIPLALIQKVGQPRYETWIRAQDLYQECNDIYSFAKRFSLSFDDIKATLNEVQSAEHYDMRTLERRFLYFNGNQVVYDTSYCNGLEEVDWLYLQDQREWFETLSEEEQNGVRAAGGIECNKFTHLYWEELFPSQLIDFVGSDRFETWLRIQKSINQCADIYSFAEHFSLDFHEFKAVVEKLNISIFYDLPTMERRFAHFIKN